MMVKLKVLDTCSLCLPHKIIFGLGARLLWTFTKLLLNVVQSLLLRSSYDNIPFSKSSLLKFYNLRYTTQGLIQSSLSRISDDGDHTNQSLLPRNTDKKYFEYFNFKSIHEPAASKLICIKFIKLERFHIQEHAFLLV